MIRTVRGLAVLWAVLLGPLLLAQSWEQTTEVQRRKWNETYDKLGLYASNGLAHATEKSFLRIPKEIEPAWLEGVGIATRPPAIAFAPLRGLDPMYFPEDNKSLWSNWADVTRAPNGRFYLAAGDHRGRDARIYLWEYDPVTEDIRRVLDFARLCGWDLRGVGDSKIHGDMGAMPDGTLWILTYWDPDPKPTPEDLSKWPGSHLVVYDTYTGRARDLGVPMPKAGWPYYSLDAVRGKFFAVGFRGEILCYDVNEEKPTYIGFPPDSLKWGGRCTMLDPDTGLFWSAEATAPHAFLSFDPRTNAFTRHAETTPPELGKTDGSNSPIRAHAHKRSEGGFIWINSHYGTLYKFWPDTRRTEVVGRLWGNETYAPRIEMSEDGRYIYAMPNLLQNHSYHQPVIQFDTRTHRRKVIAFLDDFLHERYGFYNGGAHGLALSADGGTLVFNLNGAFKPRIQPFYGNPAILVVRIPESERE